MQAGSPDDAGVSRKAGGVRPGDTNVTNLVAAGDVEVGGDLTVVGECVGCGGGATIVSLDDISDLTATRTMTATEVIFGESGSVAEGDFGVYFNRGTGTGSALAVGVDPELGLPYIGYDSLGLNGTRISFDDDQRNMVLSAINSVTIRSGRVAVEGEFSGSMPVFGAADTLTLTAANNGAVVIDTDGGYLAVTLPVLATGLHFCFFVRAGGTITIDPSGSNMIDTLTDASGNRISNSVAGSSICLVSFGDAFWVPYASAGTWVDV